MSQNESGDIPDAVREAAYTFAKMLLETQQFHEWEEALAGIAKGEHAMTTARRIRELQSRVRGGNLLNIAAPVHRKKLQELSASYRLMPAVASYLEAEGELHTLCQVLNVHLSEALDIDFALHGASSRCG